jgi:hypothetical protein
MKKILILSMFAAFALNAMDSATKEKAIANAIYEKYNHIHSTINKLTAELDKNSESKKIRIIIDEITLADKDTVKKIWLQDPPEHHAQTTLFMTKKAVGAAMKNIIGYTFKGISTDRPVVNEFLAKLQYDCNNAKTNKKHVQAFVREHNLDQ